jgi:hypothetical protein
MPKRLNLPALWSLSMAERVSAKGVARSYGGVSLDDGGKQTALLVSVQEI